jgi:hypothetical protein
MDEEQEIWINGVQYEPKRTSISHGCSGCAAKGRFSIDQKLCAQLPKCVAPNVIFIAKHWITR